MNTSEIDLDMHIGLDEESDFTDINGSSISIKTLLQRSVQSICWTYSIYWKFSQNKGLLEWNDGFYNGEIKTRRTVQMANGSSDELCGERSLQLRDLFISLGREDEVLQPQPRRRFASLSPEDLTDVEWFYLVSMSFEFRPPNGLPGQAFANSCPVWLCRAAQADSTTFSRNLLAKSAGIETVLCIPLSNGVLELGVTRMVVENTNIVECIRGMLNGEIAVLGDTYSARSEEEGSILDVTHHSHSGGSEEDMTTASDDMDSDMHRKTTQTWSCLQLGMETQEAQSGQDMSFNVAEASSMSSSFHGAFAKWSSNEAQNSLPLVKSEILEKGSQVLLKRVLMNSTHLMGATKSSSQCNSSDDNCGKIPSNEVHVLAERNRRNKINEKFRALRSLVPFVTKTDKASVLSDAINYLKHLEERVEELDNKIKENEQQSNTKASYFQNNIEDPESHKKFKRKLGEGDEGSATSSEVTRKIEIEVSIIDEVALIEFICGFKEGLILHMMEVLASLKIEPYDLQCSRSNDDWFIGTIKANVKKQRGGQRVTIPRVKDAIRAILP